MCNQLMILGKGLELDPSINFNIPIYGDGDAFVGKGFGRVDRETCVDIGFSGNNRGIHIFTDLTTERGDKSSPRGHHAGFTFQPEGLTCTTPEKTYSIRVGL